MSKEERETINKLLVELVIKVSSPYKDTNMCFYKDTNMCLNLGSAIVVVRENDYVSMSMLIGTSSRLPSNV